MSHESNFLSYSECEIAKFSAASPLDSTGRAYSAPPDSPAAQRFFSSLHSLKNRHPQKIAWYGTAACYVLKDSILE